MWCHRNTRCILPASHTALSPPKPAQKVSASENRRFYSEEKSNKIKARLKKAPLRFNGIHCVFKFPRHC